MEKLSNYSCESNKQWNQHKQTSASFQGVKKSFDFAHANEAGIKDNLKYFLPNAKIENHNL